MLRVAEIVHGVVELAVDHSYIVFLHNSNVKARREIVTVQAFHANKVIRPFRGLYSAHRSFPELIRLVICGSLDPSPTSTVA